MDNSEAEVKAFDLQMFSERLRMDSNALTICTLEELEFVEDKNLKAKNKKLNNREPLRIKSKLLKNVART